MIRVACIGVGNISPVHLNYLRARKDVEIAALCDIQPETLERRLKEYGGAGFANFNVMLDSVQLDAVWLCTPPQVRREPLLACARRGIPVMSEKPVERDLAKAKAIARDLKKLKARVQVGYVFRSLPTLQRLREAMADDKIHVIQSFYGCGVSLDMSLPAWFYEKALSGGALIDQATHNLDLLRLLMGEVAQVRGLASNPVKRKKGKYTIDEVLTLSFLFKSRAAGSHTHTWVGDAWRNEILLIGEKRLYRLHPGSSLTIEEGGTKHEYRENSGRMYDHENARFLEMVTSGDWSRNPSTYEDGVKTLALTLECDEALGGA